MGGNIFQNTRRYSKNEYQKLESIVLEKLSSIFPRIANIPYYRSKDSFGDMDILVEKNSGNGDIIEKIKQEFLETLVSQNSNVYSFVYGLEKNDFQIDLIFTKSKYFESSRNYFSFNDLNNLSGRISRKFGLKLGFDGLSFVLRDGTHVFDTIEITTDFEKIYTFLDLDYIKFIEGFDTLEDIFTFISSSKYFNPDIYLFHNRNNKSQVRDRKRKTYNEFLKWCELNHSSLNKYPWLSYNERIDNGVQYSNNHIPMILKAFPEIENKYTESINNLEISKLIKEKFNGRIVMELTGLEDKELGEFMGSFRKEYSKEWLYETSKEDIEKAILSLKK
jgi:hypothetical protein